MKYITDIRKMEEALDDSFPESKILSNIKQSSKSTLNLFERTGITKVQKIRDAFYSFGLLE
jgi:hypothetical protein